MARSHFGVIVNKSPSGGIKFGIREDAKICLECPLPANKCRPSSCTRYKEEKAKLLEQGGKK